MISLNRDRNPTSIPSGFHGPGRLKKEDTLLRAKRDHLQRLLIKSDASHGFKSSWWKAAKTQLRIESSGKCAYCEARADAVAHCDVEHFRPKAVWWWLTCCWDNYLFACQICNQQNKGEKFPLAGTASTSPVILKHTTSDKVLVSLVGKLAPDPLVDADVKAHLAKLKNEKSSLINPYVADPEEVLAYEADDLLCQVRIIPRTNSATVKRIVNASINDYGLNREELCELRYETFEALDIAREALDGAAITDAKRTKILNRLKGYVNRRRAFAGMSRYFLIDAWGLLPPDARK